MEKKELKKLLGLARIALTAWITFGLGLLASGHFSKMLTIAYPIISVCFLLIYDSIFDCYLKGKNK